MKKKILALSFLSLASVFALVSCGENNVPTTSGSFESSTPVGAGRITISMRIPKEIEVNKTLDLEDYVTVTKISTWSLESDSETIAIEGHTIKGIDFGDFSVKIVAGATTKTYKGTIVSKEKTVFNEKVSALENNYSALVLAFGTRASTKYDTSMGFSFHNEKYFATQKLDSNNNPTTSYSGYLKAPNSNTYSMSFEAGADDASSPTNLVIDPGIQRDYSNYTLAGSLSFEASDFKEVLKDGSPTGIYEMVNRSTNNYGGTLVSDFGSCSAGLTLSSFVQNYNATFWAELGYDKKGELTGDIVFHLVGTSQGKTGLLGVAVDIFNVDTTKIDPIDSWLTSPTYPGNYDVSSIANVFDNMNSAKNYTVESSGFWLNASSGEKASVKDASAATASAKGALFTYDVTTYVTENDYYSRIDALSDASAYGTDFVEGGTVAAVVRDNTFYTVDGKYAQGTTTWEEPVASTDIVAQEGQTISIWDSTLSSANFTLENLNKANWNEKVTSSSGDAYYFNELGEDQGNLIVSSYLQIGNYIGATILVNFIVQNGYTQYLYNYYAVETNGDLTFVSFIPWGTVNGTNYYYFMQNTFTNIGKTTIPQAANLSGIKIPSTKA